MTTPAQPLKRGRPKKDTDTAEKQQVSRHIDWSEWDQYLGTESDASLAARIGCSKLSVLNRRKTKGVKPMSAARWESPAPRPAVRFRFSATGEMPAGVYVITCIPTGEQYVGCSRRVLARVKTHAGNLSLLHHENKLIADAVREHGPEAFVIEIVELCEPRSETEREQVWILNLNPAFNRRGKKPQESASRT